MNDQQDNIEGLSEIADDDPRWVLRREAEEITNSDSPRARNQPHTGLILREFRPARRDVLKSAAAVLASAVVGVQSFQREREPLHVMVVLQSRVMSNHQISRLLEQLRDFFPEDTKLAVIDPSVEVAIAGQEQQFFHWQHGPTPGKPVDVHDALGNQIDRVRWCHVPTGFVSRYDSDFNVIVERRRAPLVVTPRSTT